VKINDDVSKTFLVNVGVHQGLVFTPLLFMYRLLAGKPDMFGSQVVLILTSIFFIIICFRG